MSEIQCFAWLDNDHKFGIDIDMISLTERGVKNKLLQQSMGWRYDYDGHDEEWQRLLTFGQIVPVVVSLRPPATPKEETDAMVAELREAGGSDLDDAKTVAEQSRAAFESWYFERNVCLPRIYSGDHPLTGHYVRLEARMAWAAWQAAIAATGEDAEKWQAMQRSFSRPDQ